MVSVIIPNLDGESFLKGCLGCLRAQTYRALEIILVDGGSTDGSIQLVRESFSEVRILQTKNKNGFAGAVNEGIKLAKGEFIALLNNDTMADCKWIEELLRGMNLSEEIGFCASKILRIPEGKGIDTAGDYYTRYGVARKRGHNLEPSRYDETELVFGACGAAALYRKSMLEEIGYFDEDLYCTYEDVDLSFRAQLAGYKCLYVPTAVVHHVVGGTLGIDNDLTLYYGQRNMETVFFKNMPLGFLVKYLPLHIGYLSLVFVYNLARGKAKIYLRSKTDALRQIGRTFQKRKKVQDRRKASSSYLREIFDKQPLLYTIVKAA